MISGDMSKNRALEDAGCCGCYKGEVTSSLKRERQRAFTPRDYRPSRYQGRHLVYQEKASHCRCGIIQELQELGEELRTSDLRAAFPMAVVRL